MTGPATELPVQQRQLAAFDRWCNDVLDEVTLAADRHTIVAYATWHHRRRLARHVDNNTLKPWAVRVARQQIRVAINLLAWLDRRGRCLAECTQADLDRWFASGPTTRDHAIRFITWAQTQQRCPHLRVPNRQGRLPDVMAHHERVELVARLINDDTLRVADRVAGLLTVVYAQHASRLSRLTIDAVHAEAGHMSLRVGDEQIPLTAPLDMLVVELVEQHAQQHPDSPWLFPGRIAGQPRTASSINQRLRAIGVRRSARVAALHDLLGQVPTPIVADSLGYNPNFVAERAANLSTNWNGYARLRTEAAP